MDNKNNFLKKGSASVPVILGLLLTALALPAGLKLVQQRQEIRRTAVEDCEWTDWIPGIMCKKDCQGEGKVDAVRSYVKKGATPAGRIGIPYTDRSLPLYNPEDRCEIPPELEGQDKKRCVDPAPGEECRDPTKTDSEEVGEDWECQPEQWSYGACGGGECNNDEQLKARTYRWVDSEGKVHSTCTDEELGKQIEYECEYSEECARTPTNTSRPISTSRPTRIPTERPTSTPRPTSPPVESSWEGPNCDYQEIDKVKCGYGYGPHNKRMGCQGVPQGCTRGSYYPSEDSGYKSYVEGRNDFERWIGQNVYINWIDQKGWRHNKCSCGPYQVHGENCDLKDRELYKSGADIQCEKNTPLCTKLQLVDTHPAISALGSPISIRVWSRPVLNTFCSTGNVQGVKVTLINNNSGNKWTGITNSKGRIILNPTDNRIYEPECFDPYDKECNGEHYTLISEKEGYIQSYDDIYVKSHGGEESVKISESTNTPMPTPTEFISSSDSEKKEELKGDGNSDGVVNVADFSVWREEKFDQKADETKGEWQADFNSDGYVKNDDFSIWLNNLD